MLSFLRAFPIALVASTVSVSATPSLTVKVLAPNTRVDGLENLKVIATVTNTGDETLKLINDPGGVLSSFHENSFSITNAAGSRPLFNGAMVKFSPTYAAGLDDPSAFTVLAPGAHVDVMHDLSAAYNFTPAGPGDYFIEPSNHFIYVDADNTPRDLFATVEDTAKVKLSGNLTVSRVYKKRAYNSCSPEQQATIDTAASNAQRYASNAYATLLFTSENTDRYTAWFGDYTDDRSSVVQDHFRLISSNGFSTLTYECTCTISTSSAYSYPDRYGFIFICSGFWNIPDTGVDSKAGTLVHEVSHFDANGGTKDYVYGHVGAAALAKTDPAHAIMNADNHEYYAENDPPLS